MPAFSLLLYAAISAHEFLNNLHTECPKANEPSLKSSTDASIAVKIVKFCAGHNEAKGICLSE